MGLYGPALVRLPLAKVKMGGPGQTGGLTSSCKIINVRNPWVCNVWLGLKSWQ